MNPSLILNPGVTGTALFGLALLIAVPLLFYGSLASGIWFEDRGRVRVQGFGPYDALIAAGLVALFTFIIVGSAVEKPHGNPDDLPSATAMLVGLSLSTGVEFLIIAGIIGSLLLRHVSCRETFGLGGANFASVLLRAVLLLALALPLIYGVLTLSRLLLAGAGYEDSESQELVRFLAAPGAGFVRVVLAFSAVCVAPPVEEFIFRGFIYGVVRRYGGAFAGTLVNALLFAGVHQNAQSFGGLFVLAVCLTLAYEWTGSLFVPIAMHATFNLISVVSLLSGHVDV